MLSGKVIKIVLPFPTTYLCEASFSSFTSAKKVFCNGLNAAANMRTYLSSLKLDTQEICKNVK